MDDELELATQQSENQESQQSMEETIAAEWERIQARNAGESEHEETPVQRERDEKGKFTAKQADRADGKNLNNEGDPVTSDAQPTEADKAPEQAAQNAAIPAWMQMGLRKEEAEAVARAPKEAQAAFERRMRESQEGLKRMHEQLGPKAELGSKFEQAIAPYRRTMEQIGIAPEQAVQNVLAAEHGLRYGSDQQRATHALQLINSYGINLNTVFAIANGSQAPAQQQVQVPQVAAPAPDFKSAVEEAVESRFLQQEIARFAAQPGREHFEELRPLMASLVTNGAAQSLEDAYDQALRAHPVYGSQWLAKQQAEQEAQRKAEAQQKAQAARRAAAPNVARRGTLPAAKAVGTMDDTIRDEAIRLGLIAQ